MAKKYWTVKQTRKQKINIKQTQHIRHGPDGLNWYIYIMCTFRAYFLMHVEQDFG